MKAPPDSPVPLPHPPLPRRRMVSIGTPWNGLHSIGYHSIGYHCYPFQWSGMDTMALDTNRSTTGGAVRGGYARSRSWRARIRRREWFFGRPEAGKWVRSARLRTPVRRAIIASYRAAFGFEIAQLLKSPRRPLETPMTTASQRPADRPPPAGRAPALRARRRRAWPLPWSSSSPTTPAPGLRRPVASLHRLVRRGGPPRPAANLPARGQRTIATLAPASATSASIPRSTSGPGHESPCRDRGLREALKGWGWGWGWRLARPQRQAGALTADTLAVIRLTAPKLRARGRGIETPE